MWGEEGFFSRLVSCASTFSSSFFLLERLHEMRKPIKRSDAVFPFASLPLTHIAHVENVSGLIEAEEEHVGGLRRGGERFFNFFVFLHPCLFLE